MSKIQPKVGDKRMLKKFAWYPIRTDDGFSIWLSKYYQAEIFKSFPPNGPIAGLQYCEWTRVKRLFLPEGFLDSFK